MEKNYTCPFCNSVMALHTGTYSVRNPSFSHLDSTYYNSNQSLDVTTIAVHFFKCPACNKTSVKIVGTGKEFSGHSMNFIPFSNARQFPDYIPAPIREDYEEACAIVSLSPKSAATLARRCLQGMIRDFWEIKESNLSKAITALKDKIPAQQWRVLDGVRRIGNIGAHMEKDINIIVDIDPDEANKLIKLIELLLDQWYINRHNQEKLYSDIIDIDNAKQADRKRSE